MELFATPRRDAGGNSTRDFLALRKRQRTSAALSRPRRKASTRRNDILNCRRRTLQRMTDFGERLTVLPTLPHLGLFQRSQTLSTHPRHNEHLTNDF
jgi:hypothetical protein